MNTIFKDLTKEELLEIYKDIIGSRELGIRPRTLDKYYREIKTKYNFETLSLAIDFTQKIFYEEIAIRFFK